MNVKALTGKAGPGLSVEKKKDGDNKANPAIPGLYYIHGATGKKYCAAFKAVLCVCSQQSQTVHYLCSKSQ